MGDGGHNNASSSREVRAEEFAPNPAGFAVLREGRSGEKLDGFHHMFPAQPCLFKQWRCVLINPARLGQKIAGRVHAVAAGNCRQLGADIHHITHAAGPDLAGRRCRRRHHGAAVARGHCLNFNERSRPQQPLHHHRADHRLSITEKFPAQLSQARVLGHAFDCHIIHQAYDVSQTQASRLQNGCDFVVRDTRLGHDIALSSDNHVVVLRRVARRCVPGEPDAGRGFQAK